MGGVRSTTSTNPDGGRCLSQRGHPAPYCSPMCFLGVFLFGAELVGAAPSAAPPDRLFAWAGVAQGFMEKTNFREQLYRTRHRNIQPRQYYNKPRTKDHVRGRDVDV